ncbi:MAG: SGNH/GDSL hydrolase family protein [Bacteroidetes bacterium]|nr:SGNH/GDSL hydrolase family protein [Bacteroidota bacterium]
MKRIAINIITVLAFLVAIEIISNRILNKIYNREFDYSLLANNKYFVSSGLKESTEGKVWGKEFHTDGLGCRKNKQAFDSKKKKWLFIGDSVTEGVGVEDSSTFSSLCSEVLKDYNICNYSLIGYSTSDYVNVLKSVLDNDSTNELVTLFYCLNDVYGNAKTKDLPVMAKQNFIGKLNGILQNSCSTYKLLKLFFYQNSNRYFTYDLQFYKKEDAHFVQAMNDLRFCDSLCKSKNVFFNVVMLPYQSQLRDKNFTPQQLVGEYCANDSIEFSDASESLSKQTDANSLYLFADEIHFSEKGHKVISDFLSQ